MIKLVQAYSNQDHFELDLRWIESIWI